MLIGQLCPDVLYWEVSFPGLQTTARLRQVMYDVFTSDVEKALASDCIAILMRSMKTAVLLVL